MSITSLQWRKSYTQSPFEFSLHIEREPGISDKEKDNFIFLNKEFFDDEREALAKAIIDQFEFNEDGTLKGTMLAQNTSFEIGVLKELAKLFPEYSSKLLAICDKSADLLHLLSNNKEMYKHMKKLIFSATTTKTSLADTPSKEPCRRSFHRSPTKEWMWAMVEILRTVRMKL